MIIAYMKPYPKGPCINGMNVDAWLSMLAAQYRFHVFSRLSGLLGEEGSGVSCLQSKKSLAYFGVRVLLF